MSFPLYLDEHVPHLLAVLLSARGFDVLTTEQAGMRGANDETQLRFAVSEMRAIYTQDSGDYRRLAIEWARVGQSHFGIVIGTNAQPPALRDRIIALFDLYPGGLRDITLYLPRLK